MSWSYHWPLLRGAALSLMPRGVWVFGFWCFGLFGILILFDFIRFGFGFDLIFGWGKPQKLGLGRTLAPF